MHMRFHVQGAGSSRASSRKHAKKGATYMAASMVQWPAPSPKHFMVVPGMVADGWPLQRLPGSRGAPSQKRSYAWKANVLGDSRAKEAKAASAASKMAL